MSSNLHHSLITRSNYEEYFLLYVDNELSKEERVMVENFAAMNPDLNHELNQLLNTKLPAEDLSIDRQPLFAENMKLDAVDELLLLFIDDELDQEEKQLIEQKINSNSDYKLQYDLLLKTKMPDEKINYPFKKDLYRKVYTSSPAPLLHERGKLWLRMAAAVIIIFGTGILWWMTQERGTPAVTVKTSTQNQIQKSIERVVPTQPQVKTIVAATPKKKNTRVTDIAGVKRTYLKKVAPEWKHQKNITTQEVAVYHQPLNNSTAETTKPVNNSTVTSDVAVAYNQQASANTMVQDVVTASNKKSSIKGLLRKATRFIERRTGINPVNEDDELLIGAVAIKLK
ncbi:MAG: hypothetical protein ICV66_03065 [Chitinophagaceae bacterium]|nr:hypothetical protein [Chitinophagaceae bacterium]